MTDEPPPPESLLPYEDWMEQSLRQVMLRALDHAATSGLPGEHHFYITFRTDHPGVVIPPRLRAQYPQEMTIVLQHQYEQLTVDPEGQLFSVRLSFGSVPSTLEIPLEAVTGFADPHVRFALQFRAPPADLPHADDAPAPTAPADPPTHEQPADEPAEEPQVVSLDAFRRRSPKE